MESCKKYGIFIFLWIWLCLFLFGQNRESKLILKSPKPYKFDEKASVENEQEVKNETKNPSKFDEPIINDKVISVKFNQSKISEEILNKSSEFDENKHVWQLSA